MAVLSVQNLDMEFGERTLFSGVSFEVGERDKIGFIGSTATGKTTLFKLITGELKPTSGTVHVNGYSLERIRKREVPYLRRTVGVVFQDYRLIEKMTVYENVAFAMRVTNIPERQIKRRVPYVLNLVGLAGKAHSLPQELCKEDRKRAVKILKRTEGLKHRQAAEVFLLIEYVDRQRPNALQLQQKRIMHMSGKVVQR